MVVATALPWYRIMLLTMLAIWTLMTMLMILIVVMTMILMMPLVMRLMLILIMVGAGSLPSCCLSLRP